MDNFWMADPHFFHLRANELCNRPFKSVEEMNEVFISNINSVVPKKSTLRIIGDFCMGKDSAKNAIELRSRINAEIVYLVAGNHDYKGHREYKEIKYYPNTFNRIYEWGSFEVVEGQAIFMSHWAGRTWPEQGRKSWNLWGHSHSNLPDDPTALAIDVGMDCEWPGIHKKYYPFSMDELHQIMSKKVFVQIDHHGEGN